MLLSATEDFIFSFAEVVSATEDSMFSFAEMLSSVKYSLFSFFRLGKRLHSYVTFFRHPVFSIDKNYII